MPLSHNPPYKSHHFSELLLCHFRVSFFFFFFVNELDSYFIWLLCHRWREKRLLVLGFYFFPHPFFPFTRACICMSCACDNLNDVTPNDREKHEQRDEIKIYHDFQQKGKLVNFFSYFLHSVIRTQTHTNINIRSTCFRWHVQYTKKTQWNVRSSTFF